MVISEFGAGLGDILTLVYNSDRYNCLEKMGPDERAMIVLMSHNPHAKELFLWHPNSKQFSIHDVGFWWPDQDREKRAEYNLPPAQPFHFVKQDSAKFYPSPKDYEILSTLESFPFVVMNACAGGPDRNIPDAICEDISQAITGRGHEEFGIRTVVVGRSYRLDKRRERKFVERGGLIDLTDKLSVPGTLELIARSRGAICCHSAMCLASWYVKKPTFLLYPKDVGTREFDKPAHQYTFGKDFPSTIHIDFGSYKRAVTERFINIVGKAT